MKIPRRDTALRQIRTFFRHEVRRFRDVFASDKEFYDYPWFLMIGEEGSGKTTLLGASGLQPWSAEHASIYPGAHYCSWWCSGSGTVVDISGSCLVSAGEEGAGENIVAARWKTVLNLLRRYRRRRPIDGVLVAISAADLLDDGSGETGGITPAERGGIIARRLRMISSQLGMSVPIYPIITKCDHVAGFADFCRMIPEERRGEIFGWSNPNSLDTPYEGAWVAEAFGAMGTVVAPVRLEMFADLPAGADGDGLFLFPSQFRLLAGALHDVLDPIFAPHGTHARMQMRGIYFTGDASEPVPIAAAITAAALDDTVEVIDNPPAPGAGSEAGTVAAVAPVERTLYFAEQLLYKKIFPEFTIAHPLSGIGFAKNRLVLLLQIASLVVVALGIFAGYVEYPALKKSAEIIYITLDTVRHDLHEHRLGSIHTTADDVQHVQHLLDGIIRVEQCRTISPLFPTSWFSHLHDSIDLALGHAFNRVIMQAMYHQLTNRVASLREHVLRRESEGEVDGFSTSDIYEYRALRLFTDQLLELQKHAELYNGLKSTQRVGDLAVLVEYLFGRKLPESFMGQAGHFSSSIETIDPRTFQCADYHDTLKPVVDYLLDRLLVRLFGNNIVLTSARSIRDNLNDLQRGGASGIQVTARLSALARNIGTLRMALQDTSLAWLSKRNFEAEATVTELLHDLDASLFFQSSREQASFSGRFFDSCRSRFIAVRQEIRSLASDVIDGPIVPVEPATEAFLPSPALDSLKSSIEAFLARPFMRVQGGATPGYTSGFARQLIWNADELAPAIKVFENYDAFADENIAAFPKGLQPVVMLAARSGVEATAADIINGAYRIEANAADGESVRREVQSLQKASPNLLKLLDLFDRQNFTLRGTLLTMLWKQCEGIFGAMTLARESNRDLYSINNHGILRWLDRSARTSQPLSQLLLDVEGEAGITEKLAADRFFMEELAQQGAQPTLEFLGAIGVSSRGGDVEEWRKILTELQKHAKGVPGNSVAVLEALFLDLDNITEDNFRDKLVPKGTTNYFLRRRELLRGALDTMFSERVLTGAAEAYNDLRHTFNTMLMGRYPFVDFSAHESKRISSVALDELDEYFSRLDAFVARYSKVRKEWGESWARPAQRQAHAFIDSLIRVRNFLAPITDADSEQHAEHMLDIEFRVNQVKEFGGRDIIGWNMEVGEQRMNIQDYMRRGGHPWRVTWKVGDKIAFQLRWAEHSPVMPHDVFLGRAKVDGRTVEYLFNTSTWSLIHLLSVHRPPVQHIEKNAPPHILEFAVNTIARITTADAVTTYSAPEPLEARVFIRVVVVGRTRRDHMVMPVFPTTLAPELRGD